MRIKSYKYRNYWLGAFRSELMELASAIFVNNFEYFKFISMKPRVN
jgi:hypothetical protein